MAKKDKKETNSKDKNSNTAEPEDFGTITTKKELKSFLLNIRDKIEDESAAPVYCVTAMNYVLNIPKIYELLDKENKEIARDIWLRLKSVGIQLKNPPLLFSPEEDSNTAPA